MKCSICGARMRETRTDLPFKIAEQAIVVFRNLPVLQCENCAQDLIEDSVLGRVDAILATLDGAAELQVIRDAA